MASWYCFDERVLPLLDVLSDLVSIGEVQIGVQSAECFSGSGEQVVREPDVMLDDFSSVAWGRVVKNLDSDWSSWRKEQSINGVRSVG